MNPTDYRTKALQEIFATYLLAEAYEPQDLAAWCRKSYPSLERCRDFREQLLEAIRHPGLVSPKTYELWTLDDGCPTQELLQAHFKKIWNLCFSDEAIPS